MTFSDQEIQENAFAKGLNEITARDREEAHDTREEIKTALRIKKAQYYNRQNGFIKHTPAERDAIKKIFRRHKVLDPWGAV